jgi:hypothetical protein
MNRSMKLNALEVAVLETLFSGDNPVFGALRSQLAVTEVHSRQLTECGFFTYFAVPANVVRADRRLQTLGDAVADIDGLVDGAGFGLVLNEGLIDTLEGFSFDEPWPREIGSFKVRRTGKDWDALVLKKLGY